MPTWAYFLIGTAAVLTASGVVWKKGIRPLVHLIHEAETMLPLLVSLNKEFKDTPHAFAVLDEIVAQFRTDSGSSLRDAVNRIENAAAIQTAATEKAAAIADSLKVGVEAAKLLAGLDRDKLQSVVILLDRLTVKIDSGASLAEGVAHDLAASQARASAVESSEAGAAADAAAVNDDEKR